MSFTASQAARLSGCTPSQVRHWARRELVVPTAPDRQYDFRDLVALRVVRALLDAGLPTHRVETAVAAMCRWSDDLASLRIVTDGHGVWACHDDGEILDALRGGQLALFVGVDRVVAAVEEQVGTFLRERDAFVEQLVARG